MAENIKPILTSLLLGPLMIQAPTAAALEKSTSHTSSSKSSALRKIHFENAYQPNLFSILSTEKPTGKYVGELQEKWQFPSDHLPIGMTIEDLHIASWNVLNSAYMHWVEENSQGLARSLIAQEHIYLEGSKLTIRDLHVIECIKSMLSHPTHPKSVMSLQECGSAFLIELQQQLPEEYSIILSSNISSQNQNITIYDKRLFLHDSSQSGISKIFSADEEKSVLNAYLTRKDNGQTFRIINGHLPGKPGNPAPEEFACYVTSFASSKETIIAMGDMNFNEVEMRQAFENNAPQGKAFDFLAPYCTNIAPVDFHSKSIDHFFVFSSEQRSIAANNPEEVLTGLNETADLLNSAR